MHFQNRTLKIPKYRYLVVEVTKFDDNLFQRIVTPRTRGAQFLRMQKLAPQGIMMNDCLRRKSSLRSAWIPAFAGMTKVVRLFQRIVTPLKSGAQFLRMQKLAPQGIMTNDCLRRRCSHTFALDPGLRRDDD
jgi:hypothetical protein